MITVVVIFLNVPEMVDYLDEHFIGQKKCTNYQVNIVGL